jgi:hypothetical protein
MKSNVISLKGKTSHRTEKSAIQLIDDSIIAASGKALVWRMAPGPATLRFSVGIGRPIDVNANLPQLIGAAIKRNNGVKEVYLVAVRRRGKPDLSTPLFHAPLMNIDSRSQLTLEEQSEFPEASLASVLEWHKAIHQMTMTSVGHERTIRIRDLKPGAAVSSYNHLRFWRGLSRECASFPSWSLVERKETFGQWLNFLSELK